MVDSNGKSSMLVGLFVGAAAGSIAALLLAPTTGKQSRELVREGNRGIAYSTRVWFSLGN